MPYGKVNRKTVDEQVARDEAERSKGQTYWNAQDGANNIRVLPPPPDVDYIFFKTATHWGIGPSKANLHCPRAQDADAECFLCELSYKLSKSKSDADQGEADRIRAKKQWLYNIVDLDDPDAGFQIGAFGIRIHEQIAAYLKADAAEEYGDITDPEEGTNLILTKKGTGMNTKYDVRARRKASALPESILALLENEDPADLSTIRAVATNEKMESLYNGLSDSTETEAEEDEAPVVRRRRGAVAEVEEEEDEEKPAPRSSRRASRDDDEEEEEVEEKPKRSSVGSRLRSRVNR